MKFKNLPKKVKRTPEQLAIAAFISKQPRTALHTVLKDMSIEQVVRFIIHALKTTRFKSYALGIENLEMAVNRFLESKDKKELKKAFTTFDGAGIFYSICQAVIAILSEEDSMSDINYIGVIPWTLYNYCYGDGCDKYLFSDILAFRYNNTNFGLLYAN